MYYTIEKERAANSSARLITAYKRTDGFCIELYHWLRGASYLEIKIRGEDYVEHLLTRKVKVRIECNTGYVFCTLCCLAYSSVHTANR